MITIKCFFNIIDGALVRGNFAWYFVPIVNASVLFCTRLLWLDCACYVFIHIGMSKFHSYVKLIYFINYKFINYPFILLGTQKTRPSNIVSQGQSQVELFKGSGEIEER